MLAVTWGLVKVVRDPCRGVNAQSFDTCRFHRHRAALVLQDALDHQIQLFHDSQALCGKQIRQDDGVGDWRTQVIGIDEANFFGSDLVELTA